LQLKDMSVLKSVLPSGKALLAEFNGAQLSDRLLDKAIDLASPDTTISVNTAQSVSMAALGRALRSGKTVELDFNGAQLSTLLLQQAVDAASPNASIA
jgi:hypothetical protein